MKKKRSSAKILSICLAIILSICMPFIVYAHSGRTDSYGGHYNHSTGEYHYHHGYPAHQHPNGECPYDFHDNTDHSSEIPSGSKVTTSINGESDANGSDSSDGLINLIPLILIGLMIGGPAISSFIVMIKDSSKPKKKKHHTSSAETESTEKNRTPKIDVVTTTTIAKTNVKLCPRCGNHLVLRNGRYGKFYGCENYPYCKYTESIKKK